MFFQFIFSRFGGATPTSSGGKKKDKKTPAIIIAVTGVVVLLLVAAAIIIFLSLRRRKCKSALFLSFSFLKLINSQFSFRLFFWLCSAQDPYLLQLSNCKVGTTDILDINPNFLSGTNQSQLGFMYRNVQFRLNRVIFLFLGTKKKAFSLSCETSMWFSIFCRKLFIFFFLF